MKKQKRREYQEIQDSEANYKKVTVPTIQKAQDQMKVFFKLAKKGMTVFMIQFHKPERVFDAHTQTIVTQNKVYYDVVLSKNASILSEYHDTIFTLMQKQFKYQ